MKNEYILTPKHDYSIFIAICNVIKFMSMELLLSVVLNYCNVEYMNNFLLSSYITNYEIPKKHLLHWGYIFTVIIMALSTVTVLMVHNQQALETVSIIIFAYVSLQSLFVIPQLRVVMQITDVYELIALIICVVSVQIIKYVYINLYYHSKNIIKIKPKLMYIIDIALDLSLMLSNENKTIQTDIYLAVMVIISIFSILIFNSHMYGKQFIQSVLTFQTMYYVDILLVSIFSIWTGITKTTFFTLLYLFLIIGSTSYFFGIYFFQRKHIINVTKNLHYLIQLNHSIKELTKTEKIRMNYDLTVSTNDTISVNSVDVEKQTYQQQHAEVLNKLKNATQGKYSDVYYDLMATYLVKNNIPMSQSRKFQVIKLPIDDPQTDATLINQVYTVQQIEILLKSTKIQPTHILSTIIYLCHLENKKSLHDQYYLAQQLGIKTLLQFDVGRMNQYEIQQFKKFLTRQLQYFILQLIEILYYLDPAKNYMTYSVTLFRYFIKEPELILLSQNIPNFESVPQIDADKANVNYQFKQKAEKNFKIQYYDYSSFNQQIQTISLVTMAQLNQNIKYMQFLQQFIDGIIQPNMSKYEQQRERTTLQQEQTFTLQRCLQNYSTLEIMLEPLIMNRQLENHEPYIELIQIIKENISTIIRLLENYNDYLEVFCGMLDVKKLYDVIENKFHDISNYLVLYDYKVQSFLTPQKQHMISEYMNVTKSCLKNVVEKLEIKIAIQNNEWFEKYNNYYKVMKQLMVACGNFEQVFSDIFDEQQKFQNVQYACEQNTDQNTTIYINLLQRLIDTSMQIPEHLIQIVEIFTRCDLNLQKYNQIFTRFYLQDINYNIFSKYNTVLIHNYQQIIPVNNVDYTYHLEKYAKIQLKGQRYMNKLADALFKFQYTAYNMLQQDITKQKRAQSINIVQMRRALNGMIQQYFKLYKSDPSTENLHKLRNIIKLIYISPNQDKQLIYQKGSILQYNKNDYTDFNEVTNLFNVYNVIYGLKPEQIQVIINNWDLIPPKYYLRNLNKQGDGETPHQQTFITLLNQSNKQKLDISTERNSHNEDMSYTQDFCNEFVIPVDKTTQQYSQINTSDYIGQYHIIPHNQYTNIPDTGKIKLQVNRRNKFDPKNQFYLHNIREQLYPSNKLYKLLDGPAALYDFKDISNLQHFKHLNVNINSDIQALLQYQNNMNGQICKFISVLLLALLVIGNYAMYYFETRLSIRISALNMFSNSFVLENVDLTHHILYRQRYVNQNDTLPYNQFVVYNTSNTQAYNNNLQRYQQSYNTVERLIQQQLIQSSQHDSNIIQYLQHIEYKSISFFSYLFNVIKPYSFPMIDAQLINRTQIINGEKYDRLSSIDQDFSYVIQKLQYVLQPDIYYSSQIGLYNQYTGSLIIKLLIITIQQSVLCKYNVIPQSSQFITYNKTKFLNTELYKYKLQEQEQQVLFGEKQYSIFYVGDLYAKQYTQFTQLGKGQVDQYYSSLFNKSEYGTTPEQRVLYQINMEYSSMIIIFASAILIILAIIAFVGGNIAIFTRNINQVLYSTEREFNKNYLQYIGKDVLKNQIYLQTNIREKYITYINNLIQYKVSIVSFKESCIKYFRVEKKQKYYQPVLSKYCSNVKQSVVTQKYKFLQQFFFILIMIWFGQNVLQSVSMQIAITNNGPKFSAEDQEYAKQLSSLSAQLIKYQLFGRYRDVEVISQQLLEMNTNNYYFKYPEITYYIQYLFAYGFQTQCNTTYNSTFGKVYEFLKSEQKNLAIPDKDELAVTQCSRLQKITSLILVGNSSIYQEVIDDLDKQIVKRQNIFTSLHPNTEFNKYYGDLKDFEYVLFYHLISSKNSNMISSVLEIISQLSMEVTQYNAQCNINQALAYNRIIDTLTNQIIYAVVLITMYLTKYYRIKKMEFTKKNFLHNFFVIGATVLLVGIQAACAIQTIYTKKCQSIEYNSSAQELLDMLRQLVKKISYNNFDNYNPIDMNYYKNIQSNFITNTFNGSFTLDEIRGTKGSKILGTIALTNKDFYNFSQYNQITPNNLITGYFSEDKKYMEYLTVLGQLVVSSQQDLIGNINSIQTQLNTSQQYLFFCIYQLIFFSMGLFYFYILYYGIKPDKNHAQQINIIVKPYITLYLSQSDSQTYRLLYDTKYYKINKLMYQGQFFDKIQKKLDQLVNKYKEGLIAGKELIINRPNYVACCVYDEQQKCYYMVPAEDQLAAPENLCTKCVEEMLAKRVQKKTSQRRVNISSQVYIQYLIIIAMLLLYFTYVICIVANKYINQQKMQRQIESLNSHLTKLADIMYDYNLLKINCRKNLDQYYKHYQLYTKLQNYEHFWVTNNIITNNSVVDFPRLYKLLNTMKEGVFQCKLYDTSQLVDAINAFIQGNLPKNNTYIYTLNIYMYLLLILIIGIILKLTLWCTFKEMHFLDTLFGFCTKGRTQLQNHIVR